MTDTHLADELLGALVDGRYRVRDRLAAGGMATVYTALDERLDRTVALKIIHPTQDTDPRFVDRFIDEAKAIARLTHPNVVAAYDQGTHHGLPYLVMEYVRGQTLREVLTARRRLTPVEALAITEQMLAAIAAAHRAGLVHRDVKPENVLVAAAPSSGTSNLVDSVVKVTDFGLAQAVQASTGAGEPERGEPLLATVAYVAPELVAQARADPRSDVYSTGIVLFEMLTGRVPFDGDDPAEVAWRHVEHEVPRPSTYAAGLPAAVDELVRHATRRERAARPTDAGALLTEVQTVREAVTTSAVRPRAADATVVLSAVPASDRPTWARLPSATERTTRRTRSFAPAAREPAGSRGRRASATRHAPPAFPHRRVVLAAILGVVVVLLAIGGWWFGIGRWQPAPDLVGLPEAEAAAAAQEQGLQVELADPRHDEEVPAGHVLGQDPAGRVVKGGTITLTLSLGPEVHPVPDVIGVSLDVAARQLEALGLVVVTGEPRYSDTVPSDRVLAVEPEVGTEVRPGTEVTVIASKGRAPIRVPSLINQRVDDARQQLAALGLVTAIEQVESNEPEGTVVGQDPAPDAGVEAGDTVTLEVSEGPPVREVPEVRGEQCERAAQILTDAGFQVVHGAAEQGQVRFQNPSAGTGLPPESQVTIWCF